MKHALRAITLFCLFSQSAFAQNYSIRGISADTASNANLSNTSVSVLNAKDSTLVRHTRAAADGSFSITGLPSGNFILLLTYPKYADYVDFFKLDSLNKALNFRKINMMLKSKLLENVIIKGQVAAIKIKGDTTEYNAGSFKIPPNAKVEDLLRQLPGIQVDKDGKITAQGETVSKVLVDGEEFFGDDPTLVTKNLRGDMIDKVQLYDKKSDQATFTGIDDGIKNKTINLKLKEDKKNGYFGKTDVGGASGEFYQGQGMFNAFKAKEKASAYATVSNTAKTGLGREDNNKYSGSSNTEVSDDGMIYMYNRGDDLQYNGQGIPSAQTGGAHYDKKWNKDKESINANYKTGALSIDGVRNNLAQTTLPTGVTNSRDNQTFSNYTFRQKLDATYELKIDTTSNLKVSIEGTQRNTRSNSNSGGLSVRGNNTNEYVSSRKLSNEGSQLNFFTNVFYNKKLKKKGRTFSINLSQSVNNSDDEGFLNSENEFFSTSNVSTMLKVDQRKINNSNNSSFNSNITYTEPLSKTFSAVLNYGLGLTNSSSDRRSFNETTPGKYETLDNEFSNNFELNQVSNQVGLIFNYKKPKTTLNFGTKASVVNFDQVDVLNDTKLGRNFINLTPQASYQYRFSQQKGFRLNYNGNTNQPSINQIQPVRVNTDPLNISLGNPDLNPSFRSSFNASYNSYKVLSSTYLFVNTNYSFTVNPIVNSTIRDAEGRSTYQSINITDKMSSNYSFNAQYGKKIKGLGFNVGLSSFINGGTNFNYINNVLNKLASNSYSMGLTASNYVAKKYDFYLYAGPSYNTYNTTIKTGSSNNGGGMNSSGSFTIYLPKKLEISSNYNYTLTQKTEAFNQDVDYFILNSSLSKKFMKNDGLKLSLSGNDLLNQNIGFRRNAYDNYISENNYTTIKRYYMLSLIWDFNKMGGGLKPKN